MPLFNFKRCLLWQINTEIHTCNTIEMYQYDRNRDQRLTGIDLLALFKRLFSQLGHVLVAMAIVERLK